MTEDIHLLLGAYILGGLDSHERRQFEAHLEHCPRCRDDVAAAAPLPALLSKASPEALLGGRVVRSDGDLDTLLRVRRVARRRRRTRLLAGGAATLITAAAVTAVVVLVVDRTPTPPRADAYPMRPLHGESSGVVTLTEKPWGTAITLNMDNLPRAGSFTLRTVDTNGAMQPAATWSATPNGVSVLQGATSIPRPRLHMLSIVDANNTVVAMTTV